MRLHILINSSHLENSPLIATARAVGVVYEFAQRDVVENEDNRKKRQWQNQRRATDEEKWLHEVAVDLPPPPPPPAGSSQLKDNTYFAIIVVRGAYMVCSQSEAGL